ncbi:MAG: hypothetical protein OXC14_10295 [Rhodospirillaceae bacterium]|nr:hypothetical protein [Rhodospirillaceae bacterium]
MADACGGPTELRTDLADAAHLSTASFRERRWLYGPWLDFLTLGGGSFVALGAIAAFYPRDEPSRLALAGAMLFLAHFVNHPHFAHSYQVFYTGFMGKAFSPESSLAARYRFAGIMVPALLTAFFVAALAEGSAPLLGLAANLMFFTVGWHYAKQGYGILMLDAARKGLRFGAGERRHLLWNTHLAWFIWWLVANDAIKAKELWGMTYYLLDVPDALLVAMVSLTGVSTLVVARDLFVRFRVEGGLPINGLIAYVAAVYVWLMIGRIDPLLLLVVPFFHSLQYMAVVWRYQFNVEADRCPASPNGDGKPWKARLRGAPVQLARFAISGAVLGAVGFWVAPVVADTLGGYNSAIFGTTLFLFIVWTFINIHHYFIDNVIWRRDNPEARRFLFEA